MRPIERRTALAWAGAGLLGRTVRAETAMLPFANGERPLVHYPGKRALLRLTTRPPQLETPFSVFDESLITPNDAFFVRYHLADIPLEIDPDTFRLSVKGAVKTPLSLSLADLKRMDASEIVAVNQCSGNGRGLFEPRVAGGQAGNGLMGNARWQGVSLRAVLDRAGIAAEAVQVRFDGLDGPISEKTPDFVKALPIEHALDGTVLLAWGMNAADLPWLNGYPLRLVVPGYFGTYWMKHLNEITVVEQPVKTFWMDTAYRIPDNDCTCVEPGTAPARTRPIGRLKVRSFITSVAAGGEVASGRPAVLKGMAFDGGSGVSGVDVSTDGGANWRAATLGEEVGRYSFRSWQLPMTLDPGEHTLMARAIARDGQTQPMQQPWNPSGYQRNVVEPVTVSAI